MSSSFFRCIARISMYSFLLVFLFYPITSNAQSFWKKTADFTGGPKTGISIIKDSLLFVGLIDGVAQSNDEGRSFKRVLHAEPVFSLFSASETLLFAGSAGVIYKSSDYGETWDSISLNSVYPIIQIIESLPGSLFAITAGIDPDKGYVGDGVFYSSDSGKNWVKRNSGLGDYLNCERIATDTKGNLLLSVADEYATGNGGLYISQNQGKDWKHIQVRINGFQAVPDHVEITNAYGLTISPDDTVYYSFTGIAENTLVRLNAKKHFNDLEDDSYWNTFKIFKEVNYWWLDWMLNNIFYAKNGIWYSSTSGTKVTGATYYSKNSGLHWKKTEDGLETDIFDERNIQFFAEGKEDKIFMIQLLDENVYYTDSVIKRDTSIISTIRDTEKAEIALFPNPVKRGETFNIQPGINSDGISVYLYDMRGNFFEIKRSFNSTDAFKAPVFPGIYFLELRGRNAYKAVRLVVY